MDDPSGQAGTEDVRLNFPVKRTLRDRIDWYAGKRGMKMAVAVRVLLEEALDAAGVPQNPRETTDA